MSLYLLIKEHNTTGLKYLCKHSSKNVEGCFTYSGSGTYWKKHLKKYGKNISTKILFVTEDMEEFRKVAKKYSIEFNIIESNEWANLCLEQGEGGDTIIDKKLHGEKSKKNWIDPVLGPKLMNNIKSQAKKYQHLAAKGAKDKLTGISKSEEHKNNMKGKRPWVNQSGSNNNFAKKIKTPFGIFESIKDASNQIEGYTYSMIWKRLQKSEDWSYI